MSKMKFKTITALILLGSAIFQAILATQYEGFIQGLAVVVAAFMLFAAVVVWEQPDWYQL